MQAIVDRMAEGETCPPQSRHACPESELCRKHEITAETDKIADGISHVDPDKQFQQQVQSVMDGGRNDTDCRKTDEFRPENLT